MQELTFAYLILTVTKADARLLFRSSVYNTVFVSVYVVVDSTFPLALQLIGMVCLSRFVLPSVSFVKTRSNKRDWKGNS